MTHQLFSINSRDYHLVVGVLKYDFKVAGYPEVYKLATEMAKDKNFLQLFVRKVSQENWGIQFTYALPKEELPEKLSAYAYFRNTYDYAITKAFVMDLSVSIAGMSDFEDNWLVQKPFTIDRVS